MKNPPYLLSAALLAFTSSAIAGMPAPYRVKDIGPGSIGGIPDFSLTLRAVGNTLLFAASEGVNGYELWKSDGTEAGTVLVKDIRPGSRGSDPIFPLVLGSSLYFGANQTQLWKSDGTTAGTVLIKDFLGGSVPRPDCVVGNILYFSASTSSSGSELWKTDGTAAGTVMVADINPGTASSAPGAGVAIGNIYYFTALTSDSGRQLWRTDGTAEGTYLVAGNVHGASSPVVSGNAFYFVGDDGVHGRELWRSNGTATGTYMVEDFAPGPADGVSSSSMAVAGDLVYFSARTTAEEPSNWSLWRSTGASFGTFPLLSLSNPITGPMHVMGDNVFFAASVPGGKYEIWKTDGTVAGTARFKPGMTGELGYFFDLGKSFYFGGRELWQSDGTPEGTYCVADLSDGSSLSFGASKPQLLAGKIYFYAGGSNNELYAYDPAPPSISRPMISERTKTGAKIDFAVNPNGFPTATKLEYGLTDSYGTTVNLPGDIGQNFQAFGVPLSDLTLGSTYCYRVTATSSKGSRVSTGTFDTIFTREDWRLARFGSTENAGAAADDQDPDHDGLSNLIEYAFGLDPEHTDGDKLPKGIKTYGYFTLELTQPPGIEDILYGVEFSPTMEPGSWQAATDTGSGNLHSFKIDAIWPPQMFARWTVTPR